jgi:hypothetical protein
MSNQPSPSPAPAPRPQLIAIQESAVSEVASFIAAQSGREPTQVESHLRWFLLENPARVPDVPLGYGLSAPDGRLVGCVLCVPQRFRYEGRDLVLMGSSAFYVDEQFRGSGGLVFLRFTDLARRWPLFGNSANAEAALLWKARGAQPIPFSDHELFGVIKWGPILEEILLRKSVRRGPWNLIGQLASPMAGFFARLKFVRNESAILSRLTSIEDVKALSIPDETSELTAARDLPYLQWRYFSKRDPSVAVFAFRSGEVQNPVLVTVNQRKRGYRQQINTLNVLDVYPVVTPDICVSIVGALMQEYGGSVDAIVLRGLDERSQKLFCSLGFKRRQFESPNGWIVDRFDHLPTRNWRFVPADGDWLI